MKKTLSFMIIFLVFLMTCPAFGLDVSVDIKGPQELVSLKDGLARTITTRCLARNVAAPGSGALNVSIFQMGSTISLDAILASTPPKAFHKDLKSTDELSGAIDAMISDLFAPAPAAVPTPATTPQAAPEPKKALPREAGLEAKLSFKGTSMAVLDGTLYASSDDAIYKVAGGKPGLWWKAPNGIEICRLYPYRGGILAVAGNSSSLVTYLVKDGKKVASWNRCVVPSRDGLVSSRVFTDLQLPDGANHWAKPEAVEGSPELFAEGVDILSTMKADILPAQGEETVGFNKWSRLVVTDGKNTLLTSDEKFSTLPIYITTRDVTASNSKSKAALHEESEIRYYFMPRVLAKGNRLITIANHEGMSSLFGKVKIYNGARVVELTPGEPGGEQELAGTNLMEIKNDYCADIALDKGSVLALIVKKSTSYIQRISLQ